MVGAGIHDHAARVRSYEVLAQLAATVDGSVALPR
jgi:hypothetical protein